MGPVTILTRQRLTHYCERHPYSNLKGTKFLSSTLTLWNTETGNSEAEKRGERVQKVKGSAYKQDRHEGYLRDKPECDKIQMLSYFL